MDASSKGNFKTRTPMEAIKLIENLVISNSTKNADFERKKLAAGLDNDQIGEVKARLDSMKILLVRRKSVKFAQDVENIKQENKCNEEDVNFVNGSRFVGQRFGNSRNFSSNGQRNSY